jgi:hypothetical protein
VRPCLKNKKKKKKERERETKKIKCFVCNVTKLRICPVGHIIYKKGFEERKAELR